MRICATIACFGFGLVGCGSSEDASSQSTQSTQSQFGIVSGFNQTASLTNAISGSVSSGAGVVTYEVGVDNTNEVYVGSVKINQGTNPGNVGTGSATYAGNYEFGYIDQINTNQLSQDSESGTISLLVDFGNSTVTGTSVDTAAQADMSVVPELVINGTISGTTLSGTADVGFSNTVNSGTLQTTLAGEVGDEALIGAFFGNDSDTVVAGAVIVED
ncbi:MAG: transferrin-binding protein-like solute binding protein [Pseudomonadota bacterium]